MMRWLGGASLFVFVGACFYAVDLPDMLDELLGLAAALGFVGGAIFHVFGESRRRSVAFTLAAVAFVELVLAVRIDLTGPPFALLSALFVPASICGTLLGHGVFDVNRWLSAPTLRVPPEPRAKKETLRKPSVDRDLLRQLSSSATLFAVVAPLLVAGCFFASIRRDASVEATAAIVGGAAAIAFFLGELLQLRDVSTRTSTIVVGALTLTTIAAGIAVDRILFDGLLGLATPFGAMLPGATIFAAIAGWFAATGLRVVARRSPVFRAIAREERLVDDEEPMSDEVLPPSTRRLLDRVRSRRRR